MTFVSRSLAPVFKTSAVVVACLLCTLRMVSATQARQNLSGNWVLNLTASDDIGKKLKDDRHHWLSALFSPSTAAHGKVPSLVGIPALQHELFDAHRMHIDQRNGVYRITYGDGALRVVRDDAPAHASSASGKLTEGEFGYSIPYWDGDTLVLETHSDDGQQTLERYTLKKDGSRLLLRIILDVPPRAKPLVLRRIFNRTPP